ncbi:MAG TPA: Pvc16 family protein [Thermoanaerobaculia bacterium]|nr:Pvc16 family protein [Thermoanaerobaculia bacterium]
MSNDLAIAAATATLQQLLLQQLKKKAARVDLLSPDNAGKATGDRVNLFLYQTSLDAAWRNQDVPGRAKPGETAGPPLPLNLYYLLTAFSADPENELKSQSLFGEAMRIFHDHPVLGAEEIRNATAIPLPGSDLDQQVERIRIVFQALSTEEIWRLWAAFQTPYRLSAAYQVSVVLIESQRGIRAPLPVLTRGEGDRGATVLTGSLPLLDAIAPVLHLPAVRLGEDLSLTGRHLAGGTIKVVFRGPRGTGPFAPKSLKSIADGEIVASLPAPGDLPGPAKATWPAGIYTAQVIASRTGEPDRSSSELPFPLAPAITVSPLSAVHPNVTLTVTVVPNVQPGQRVSLLFGDREVPAPDAPFTPPTDTLKFTVKGLAKGKYVVRLRVDGVDSIPIDTTSPTPKFAANQTVEIL